MSKDGKKKISMAENFLIGGVAAGISKTIAAPIERIKLLLQNQGEAKSISKPYTGIMDCIKRVPAEQGFSSFWRGNAANVLRYFPTQGLNLMFKAKYRQIFQRPRSDGFWLCLAGNAAAGGAAGATSLLVVYPLDFARTRLAMDVGSGKTREFNGTYDCLAKTVRAGGLFGTNGPYKGFTISCVGIIFYRGLYFGLYDTFGDFIPKSNPVTKFAVGYAVTIVAGLASYPIDTIRRRMMMVAGGGPDAPKYTSSLNAASEIMKREGFMTFFKGAGSNILRGLCGALVLVLFDEAKAAYTDWKFADEEPAASSK